MVNTTITGGIKTTPEDRTYDDSWAKVYSDPVVGKSRARHRRIKISELSDDDSVEKSLKLGWTQDVVEGDELIDGIVESLEHGWVMRLTCGFELVDGERRMVRRFVVTKGDQVRNARMVFDFKGLPNQQ
jgi:hypothetical protein